MIFSSTTDLKQLEKQLDMNISVAPAWSEIRSYYAICPNILFM